MALRDTLRARHQEPEHRRVTVAFLHFDGTDEQRDEIAQRIAEAEKMAKNSASWLA